MAFTSYEKRTNKDADVEMEYFTINFTMNRDAKKRNEKRHLVEFTENIIEENGINNLKMSTRPFFVLLSDIDSPINFSPDANPEITKKLFDTLKEPQNLKTIHYLIANTLQEKDGFQLKKPRTEGLRRR